MKKISYLFAAALMAVSVSSCEWFELDNTEGYNASIHGAILDSKDGKPVPSEIYGWSFWGYSGTTTGYFNAYELDWDGETAQAWNIKNNGTYRNNLVVVGTKDHPDYSRFRVESLQGNHFEFSQEITVNKGDNEINFTVTPFARVLDPKISYDAADKKIVAKFKMEFGNSEVKGMRFARLCCYTDRFVGSNFNNCANDPGALLTNCTDLADGTTEVALTIDTQLAANAAEFQYTREHFVRIGICAVGDMAMTQVWDWATWSMKTDYAPVGVNSTNLRYNFSPVFRISDDFSTITEVVDW